MSKDDSKVKDANAITFKTLSKSKEMNVEYVPRANQPFAAYAIGDVAKLPHPPRVSDEKDLTLLRGLSDSLAMRIRYHKGIANRPQSDLALSIMEALEKARYESLGSLELPGLNKNITETTNHIYKEKGYTQAISKDEVPLHEVIYTLARQSFCGAEIPEAAETMLALWRPEIKKKLGNAPFSKLVKSLNDPEKFYKAMRDILTRLDKDYEDEQKKQPEPPTEPNEDDQHAQHAEEDDNVGESDEEGDEQDGEEENASSAQEEQEQHIDADQSDIPADDTGNTAAQRIQKRNDASEGHAVHYKIYTTLHDETVPAEELATPFELKRLRAVLDHQLSAMGRIIGKLANRLQRKLMAKQQRQWMFNLDDGILDTRRLTQIIADPSKSARYKQEQNTDFRNTVVSILIDNSGSMRGRPISIAAMSADILARTLERCNVKAEILGFTTRAWKGGKSRLLWSDNGQPAHPGRLNDLRHIIYKSADTPMRRAKNNLGLMLKEGILKENIDGEALIWAHNRLSQRAEQRKILMVISDGAPVDDSTLAVNGSTYLEEDLRNVIGWIESRNQVELCAIGIGHDVTRYYNRAITIRDAQELGETMIGQLEQLFGDNKNRMR